MSEEPKKPEEVKDPAVEAAPEEDRRGEDAGDKPDPEVELEPGWLGDVSEIGQSLQDSPAALEKLGIEAEEEPLKRPADKPAEEPVKAKDKVEPKPEPEPEPSPDADEELLEGSDGKKRPRYAHFQRELQLAQNRLDKLGQVQPIAEYILKDPEVLDIVDRKMKGLPLIQPKDVPPADVVPDEPEPPARPVNFSLEDAMNDPESDSYKYEIAIREYPVKLRTWQKAKDQHDEAAARKTAEADAEAEFVVNLYNGLRGAAHSYGKIPKDKVDEVVERCIEFYSKPDSLSSDLLLRVFLASLVPPKQAKEIEEKAIKLKNKVKGKSDIPPAPSGTVEAETGTIEPPLGDDEYIKRMEDDMLASGPY